MAKNSLDAYGADGKANLLFFDPEKLTLVTDTTSPLYDDRVHLPVDEAMAHNIDFQGVVAPIEISKNPETGDTEVVVGRQRVKACRLANVWRKARGVPMRQIPAVVFKGKREHAIDAIVSENEIRRADTPLGRAEKMRQLMAIGRGEDQVAMIFGCKAGAVRSTLALLDCCAEVQKAVNSGKVPVTHAVKLARLKPDAQREKVRELVDVADTKKGHDRSRAQREVMGNTEPRMKTRKQIKIELQNSTGDRATALRWVLGMEKCNDHHTNCPHDMPKLDCDTCTAQGDH
ncbi:ParB/RepB/Spo0J family partition protein [Burkholderia seminalis]|uniref:ParB/RepB/Spo0J family partition protein n=1 Tax=Burkholderia seminalis TaxID=488731 RepID=UPI001CF250FD|nr:ParB/RepB/Spo0J family partition protein [Burkholderia seminalis]MCA8426391.1 ParB/RepB/Spo0J family partition protein [Burkholderia seminalis]